MADALASNSSALMACGFKSHAEHHRTIAQSVRAADS